jgi:hypothetical protein
MVQKVKKSVSVVSKTAFVQNPQFDLDPKVPAIKYVSSTTRRDRWMVALTEASAKKLSSEQKNKFCTIENGHCYVHIDNENISGKVQFGILPWSDKGLQGFFNVKADEETQKKHDAEVNKKEFSEKVAVLKEMLEAGDIDEQEFKAMKADLLKESLTFTRK